MSISNIGVQKILPQSGAAWRDKKKTQDREDESGGDDAPEGERDQSPRLPDRGQVVDTVA
jgi:hypothetical protein